jgi:hypothetical protein
MSITPMLALTAPVLMEIAVIENIGFGKRIKCKFPGDAKGKIFAGFRYEQIL